MNKLNKIKSSSADFDTTRKQDYQRNWVVKRESKY